jgi:hypothetical protein
MLYFQTVSSLACYCKPDFEDLHQISYPIAKQGYANITRFYGTSNLNANRFTFMATTFKDQPSAHEAFAANSSMDMEIWYEQSIVNNSRDWAKCSLDVPGMSQMRIRKNERLSGEREMFLKADPALDCSESLTPTGRPVGIQGGYALLPFVTSINW